MSHESRTIANHFGPTARRAIASHAEPWTVGLENKDEFVFVSIAAADIRLFHLRKQVQFVVRLRRDVSYLYSCLGDPVLNALLILHK